MFPDAVRASLHAGALLSLVGVVAWATGQPFIFPSLGPSAFVLATMTGTHATDPRRVVGGHLIGVVVGVAAYALIADGAIVTATHLPLSGDGLRLALSGVLSVMVTTGAMMRTDTIHPPACATTLIVSLGLLSTVVHGVIIMTAVVALVAANHLLVRVESNPLAGAVPPGQ